MPAGPDQQECLVAPSAVLGPPPGLSLVPLLPTACQPGGGDCLLCPGLIWVLRNIPVCICRKMQREPPPYPVGGALWTTPGPWSVWSRDPFFSCFGQWEQSSVSAALVGEFR